MSTVIGRLNITACTARRDGAARNLDLVIAGHAVRAGQTASTADELLRVIRISLQCGLGSRLDPLSTPLRTRESQEWKERHASCSVQPPFPRDLLVIPLSLLLLLTPLTSFRSELGSGNRASLLLLGAESGAQDAALLQASPKRSARCARGPSRWRIQVLPG